ncbi:MAG: methyltransferase domain-containing protein [Candidatus Latescibacterota bacterium]|nr:MAG: methyltransferase domain-containing protein [Candidatus Latescibacterota bacterium]
MIGNGGQYIHGTDPDEQKRLSVLNDLLNDASLTSMNIQEGSRILDVGSGLGQFTRMMARAAGTDGTVIGIERDSEQIKEAARQARIAGDGALVEFRTGDAVGLPLRDDEWGTFDIAHARFLLEHVPDPLAVVRSMVGAVKIGGRVVLEDDDHDVMRLWPELPVADRLWRTYADTYRRVGNDPFVGRRLVALLHEAGASPRQNRWLPFSSCAGHPLFKTFMANFAGVISSARQTIISSSAWSDEEFDHALTAIEEWSRRPDAALWYGTFWAEGVRRELGR